MPTYLSKSACGMRLTRRELNYLLDTFDKYDKLPYSRVLDVPPWVSIIGLIARRGWTTYYFDVIRYPHFSPKDVVLKLTTKYRASRRELAIPTYQMYAILELSDGDWFFCDSLTKP